MRTTTYSCDICRAPVNTDNAVGVEFKSAAQGRSRLDVGIFRDVERHICRNCLADLSNVARKVKEGTDK